MFNLLIGRALMRWLEKLGEQEDAAAPPLSIPSDESNPSDKSNPSDESDPSDPSASAPEIVYPRVERAAMGSLFEIYLAGTDRETLIGAGEEALNEIERLDRQLSHYRDDSDIARLNHHATAQWVRLEPRLYSLLKRCAELSQQTGGAFDTTTGPLTKAWGFYRGEGRIPSDEEIARILDSVGTHRILFDDEDQLVHFPVPGLEIELGAIGKGYAIDEAVETLKLYEVENAVIHGGQSTIYGLGNCQLSIDNLQLTIAPDPQPSTLNPQPLPGWQLTIKDPRDRETPIQSVVLYNEALSTSGSYEQFFELGGKRYSHILDPRSGRPVEGMLSVSVIAPNAADSDALSTAFFVMGREATLEFCATRPEIRVIMMQERSNGELDITRIGL